MGRNGIIIRAVGALILIVCLILFISDNIGRRVTISLLFTEVELPLIHSLLAAFIVGFVAFIPSVMTLRDFRERRARDFERRLSRLEYDRQSNASSAKRKQTSVNEDNGQDDEDDVDDDQDEEREVEEDDDTGADEESVSDCDDESAKRRFPFKRKKR